MDCGGEAIEKIPSELYFFCRNKYYISLSLYLDINNWSINILSNILGAGSSDYQKWIIGIIWWLEHNQISAGTKSWLSTLKKLINFFFFLIIFRKVDYSNKLLAALKSNDQIIPVIHFLVPTVIWLWTYVSHEKTKSPRIHFWYSDEYRNQPLQECSWLNPWKFNPTKFYLLILEYVMNKLAGFS